MADIVFRVVTGSGASEEALDYIASNDPGCGKEFKPGLCRVRHIAAKLREARGNRHEYEPCAYCPHFVTEPVEKPPAEPQTMCRECGQRKIKSGFELCGVCLSNFKKPKFEEVIMSKYSEQCNECKAPITPLRKRKSGLCDKCYKRAWLEKRAGETTQKPNLTPAVELPPIVITAKEPVAQENPMNTEHCNECFKPIAAHRKSKCGLCIECYRRKSNAAKVTQAKSNIALEPESNMNALGPFRRLLEEYRRAEKAYAEGVEEARARFDALVDKKRIAKRYADELEKVIQELES